MPATNNAMASVFNILRFMYLLLVIVRGHDAEEAISILVESQRDNRPAPSNYDRTKLFIKLNLDG